MGQPNLQVGLQTAYPAVIAVPPVHVPDILLQNLVPLFRLLRLKGHGAEHTHGADHIGIPADLFLGEPIVVVPHLVVGPSTGVKAGVLGQGADDVLPAVRLLVVVQSVVEVLLEGVPAPAGQMDGADMLLRVCGQELLTQVGEQEPLVGEPPDVPLPPDQAAGSFQGFQQGGDGGVPGEHFRQRLVKGLE